MWLSQVDLLSSKHTPVARKTHYSLSLFNLTQARAADDELWCRYTTRCSTYSCHANQRPSF